VIQITAGDKGYGISLSRICIDLIYPCMLIVVLLDLSLSVFTSDLVSQDIRSCLVCWLFFLFDLSVDSFHLLSSLCFMRI